MRVRAVSSVGRAPALQAGGRWFEPGTAHSLDPAHGAGSQPEALPAVTATAGLVRFLVRFGQVPKPRSADRARTAALRSDARRKSPA
jgi:hypothetical protein